MKTINISSFGTIISNIDAGNHLATEIRTALATDDTINIDFSGVISMATFCAKQIFGQLYRELGSNKFSQRINIINANDDIKVVISDGITDALQTMKIN